MPMRLAPTTINAPLSKPSLFNFLPRTLTGTPQAFHPPTRRLRRAGRMECDLGPLGHPPALRRKQFPQPKPPSPPEHIFSQPWKKSMSELTQGTEKNFGAAFFIALQLITPHTLTRLLMLLREFLTKKSGTVPYTKTLVCALHVVRGQTHSALSI
jgi:hypothetical protein